MQILRNRTQNNFTIISNEILRNRELSLKDCGLLCTLIGLPDSWKFSVKGLASIIIDGKDSIRTSLIKLEKLGYVNRYAMSGFSDTSLFFHDFLTGIGVPPKTMRTSIRCVSKSHLIEVHVACKELDKLNL